MLDRIRRIGCIHFDKADSENPIPTIEAALANCRHDVSDTLIVLPEALDLGNGYYSKNAVPVFADNVLKRLSRSSNVAFVAGLSENACFRKPYNSAFLVDPESVRVRRLSRKMNGDPNAQWYEGSSGDAQCLNYRGLTIASLICQDATEFAPNRPGTTSDLHQRVLACLRSGQDKNVPILCVPARMTRYTPSSEAKDWPPDISVVIANVKMKGDDWSGIRVANGDWKPCQEGLCLEELPSAGAVRSGPRY